VTCNGESRRRNCYSRGQGRSPGRKKGPHQRGAGLGVRMLTA
jgi:hypothetical protein